MMRVQLAVTARHTAAMIAAKQTRNRANILSGSNDEAPWHSRLKMGSRRG